MNIKQSIEFFLQEQWQYFSDKALLVLSLGNKDNLAEAGLIDNEGFLNTEFKQAFTQTLINTNLIDQTVGPFDDDYFSGIENDKGQLSYFFEIHKMEQEQVLAFLEFYPVVFVVSDEEN